MTDHEIKSRIELVNRLIEHHQRCVRDYCKEHKALTDELNTRNDFKYEVGR